MNDPRNNGGFNELLLVAVVVGGLMLVWRAAGKPDLMHDYMLPRDENGAVAPEARHFGYPLFKRGNYDVGGGYER